jgi:hypothetical protein
MNYLQTNIENYQPHWKVIIRVYAKITIGLRYAYAEGKMLADANAFQKFVHGFNEEHVLCEYVEAGHDKEGADSKLKGLFRRPGTVAQANSR